MLLLVLLALLSAAPGGAMDDARGVIEADAGGAIEADARDASEADVRDASGADARDASGADVRDASGADVRDASGADVRDASGADVRGAIEADIRGTTEPLAVRLLFRDEAGKWQELRTTRIAAGTHRLRFDDLPSGVYQLLLLGDDPTERLATPIALAPGQSHRASIVIEPIVLAGHLTQDGADAGSASLLLRAGDDLWNAPIAVAADGTFVVPLWQRGQFLMTARASASAAPHTARVKLEGSAPLRLHIDIPSGLRANDTKIAGNP